MQSESSFFFILQSESLFFFILQSESLFCFILQSESLFFFICKVKGCSLFISSSIFTDADPSVNNSENVSALALTITLHCVQFIEPLSGSLA